jgi:hypothetical protein
MWMGRTKPGEAKPYITTRDEVFLKATKQVLECEFKWGARLSELTPTKITTVTNVMGCIDTTTITGSIEEMELLFKAACNYSYLKDLSLKPEYREALGQKAMRVSGGNPAVLELAVGLIVGEGPYRGTLFALFCEQDAAVLDKIKAFDNETLWSMIELKYGDKLPVDEILELA